MKQIDKNSFIKNGYIILEDMIKPDQLSKNRYLFKSTNANL